MLSDSRTNTAETPRKRYHVAPTRILGIITFAIPVIVLFVYALVASRSIWPWVATPSTVGPVDKSTVFQVSWQGALPEHRTAYVYSLMAGEADAEGRYAGVRLGIELIRHTKSSRDIVVMVSQDVPMAWRDTLRRQGAYIVELPATRAMPEQVPIVRESGLRNPTVQVSRIPVPPGASMIQDAVSWAKSTNLGNCRPHFAQLHAWGLYDVFDRVVVIEPNYVQQLNMDELFLCGEFCMVYSNLNWYNTALLVLKPSVEAHKKFFDDMSKLDHSTLRSDDDCKQAFEDYVLGRFFPVEAAPIFRPTEGQQNAPVMRLPSGYAVNPLFWYEKYSWHLARVKEYANLGGETVFEVPAHGIMWPRGHPWSWFPCIWFNVHWIWHYSRYVMLREPTLPFILPPIIALIAMVLFIGSPLERFTIFLLRPPRNHIVSHGSANSHFSVKVSKWLNSNIIRRIGWTSVGCVLGVVSILLALPIAKYFIPDATLYYYAWPIFIPLHIVTIIGFLRFFTIIFVVPLVGTQAWAAASLIKTSNGALRVAATIALEDMDLDVQDTSSKSGTEQIGNNVTTISSRMQVLAAKEPLAADLVSSKGDRISALQECFSRLWWSSVDSSSSEILRTTGLIRLFNDKGYLPPVVAAFAARQVTSLSVGFYPILAYYIIYALMHPDIFPHFVLKIVIMFGSLACLAGVMLRPFVAVFRISWFADTK